MGPVDNNPFLKLRQKFIEKEKQRSLRNIESYPVYLDEQSFIVEGKTTLRYVRLEQDRKFVEMCSLGPYWMIELEMF